MMTLPRPAPRSATDGREIPRPVIAGAPAPPPAANLEPHLVPARPAQTRAGWASLVAAAAHLALLSATDGRPGAGTALVVVVAAADAIVAGLMLTRRPRPGLIRLAVVANAVFAAAWLLVRAATPPSAPSSRPGLAGLLTLAAMGAVMVTLALAARALPCPPPRPRSRGAARSWAALAGGMFGVFFLLSSGALSYVSASGGPPSLRVAMVAGWPGSIVDIFGSPLIYGWLAPHVWLVGSVWTLVFATGAAAFVAVDVAVRLRPAACPRPGGLRAVVPTALGVSSCCGPSVGILLGTVLMAQLARLTPWLLVATIVLLALDIRRLRPPPTGRPSTQVTATSAAAGRPDERWTS